MKNVKANPEHEVAYQDVCALVSKYASNISAIELLAIASNMIGKLLALQDQRLYTSEMVMKVVADNIQLGNMQALEEVSNSKGNA